MEDVTNPCQRIMADLFFILHVQEEAPKPLDKVVVCVSKKLSKKQSELNGVAASLGAEYR